MRFKYKKLIIGLTLGVMCIGFMTFSMMEPSGFSIKKKTTQGTSKNDKVQETSADVKKEEKPLEGNEIQKDIEDLIVHYMKASQNVDMDAIAQYVTNAGNVDDRKLLTWAELIEDTKNISCTIMAGDKEGTYVVYIYYEYKFFGVETPAPALDYRYIITTDDGDLRIYTGAIDSETQGYINQLTNCDAIKGLSDSVTQKLSEALRVDKDLYNLYAMMESIESDKDDGEENEE